MTNPLAKRNSRRNLIVWGVLVIATLVSWSVGADHAMAQRISTVFVLVVAFLKVYLVASTFMELRSAAPKLRTAFYGVCAGVCVAVIGMYLATG